LRRRRRRRRCIVNIAYVTYVRVRACTKACVRVEWAWRAWSTVLSDRVLRVSCPCVRASAACPCVCLSNALLTLLRIDPNSTCFDLLWICCTTRRTASCTTSRQHIEVVDFGPYGRLRSDTRSRRVACVCVRCVRLSRSFVISTTFSVCLSVRLAAYRTPSLQYSPNVLRF